MREPPARGRITTFALDREAGQCTPHTMGRRPPAPSPTQPAPLGGMPGAWAGEGAGAAAGGAVTPDVPATRTQGAHVQAQHVIRATHHTWSGLSLAHGWPCALHAPATSQKRKPPARGRITSFALDREAGQCTPRALGCPRPLLPRRKKFGAGGTLTQGRTSNTVGEHEHHHARTLCQCVGAAELCFEAVQRRR